MSREIHKKPLTKVERENILRQFVAKWGEDAEIKMAIEEMAELTKELCKSWRGKTKSSPGAIEENRQHIREEIADVLITVGNLKMIFGAKEIEEVVDAKLRRGLVQLKKYQEERK
ncbi:MAG: hypothetical protein LBU20_00555 [Candidatus Nomurabacteria bacterium]|jgi:NTP pyrophosphatase (non-canonical NTP hydrolase)|nr:hypothetical protein [Candidatus Nomurabacteria bacterium]